jgi:hypothetical protein
MGKQIRNRATRTQKRWSTLIADGKPISCATLSFHNVSEVEGKKPL